MNHPTTETCPSRPQLNATQTTDTYSPKDYEREIARLERLNRSLTANVTTLKSAALTGVAKSDSDDASEDGDGVMEHSIPSHPSSLLGRDGGTGRPASNNSKSTVGGSNRANNDKSQSATPQVILEFSPSLMDPPFSTISSVSGSGNSAFVRNKAEIDKTFVRLVMLHRQMERMSMDATNGEHTQLLQQSGEIIDILSSLQDTNHQNESTITNLQRQLIAVTKDREAARSNSKRLENQIESLKKEIHLERVGFAVVSRIHKKEIEQLKRRANKLRGQNKFMKLKLKEQEAMPSGAGELMNNSEGSDELECQPTGANNTVASKTVDPLEDTLHNEDRTPSITNETMLSEVDYWKDKYEKSNILNDELLDKIGQVWAGELSLKSYNNNDAETSAGHNVAGKETHSARSSNP